MSKKNKRNAAPEPTPTSAPSASSPESVPERDAAAVVREMAAKVRDDAHRRERERLVLAAAEAGMNERPGTAWWAALAPLTEEERKLAREARDKMLAGEYGP